LSIKEDMFFQTRLGQFTSPLSMAIADLVQLSSQHMMWRNSLPV